MSFTFKVIYRKLQCCDQITHKLDTKIKKYNKKNICTLTQDITQNTILEKIKMLNKTK